MSSEFYLSEEGVKHYFQLSSDSDSTPLINALKPFIKSSSILLELGSGPGREVFSLLGLKEVIYSDYSPIFLRKLKEKHPDCQVLFINAKQFSLADKVDVIYSNKVLHHFTNEELTQSILSQKNCLSKDGILCHSFWHGEKNTEHHGLLFNHHTINEIRVFFKDWEILSLVQYEEFVPGDSIQIIAKLIE